MLQDETLQDPLEYKNKANEYYKKGNYKESIPLYSTAIQLEPCNPTFYSNRSAAYWMLKDFVSSLQDCEKALQLDPSLSKIYSRAGKCQVALGHLEGGIELLQKALETQHSDEWKTILTKEVSSHNIFLYLFYILFKKYVFKKRYKLCNKLSNKSN
jgi:tetratricopeptide (TPR) repeat protein